MDALGRMAAIILAVILLVLFPIRYEAQKTDITRNTYIDTELDHFYHMICIRHEVTQQMYAEFCEQLAATGDKFTIEIERYSNVIYTEEASQNYLDYEDLCWQLKSSDRISLSSDDYVSIHVHKQQTTIIDRLKNMFLPTAIHKTTYVMGGVIG